MFAAWRGLAGLALLGVSLMLACYTLWFRVDSLADLDFIRCWNIVLGLPFAGAGRAFAGDGPRLNSTVAAGFALM